MIPTPQHCRNTIRNRFNPHVSNKPQKTAANKITRPSVQKKADINHSLTCRLVGSVSRTHRILPSRRQDPVLLKRFESHHIARWSIIRVSVRHCRRRPPATAPCPVFRLVRFFRAVIAHNDFGICANEYFIFGAGGEGRSLACDVIKLSLRIRWGS